MTTFPSRKMPVFLDADLENTFPSIKTAYFMDSNLKNNFLSTKSTIFMDRTARPFPMGKFTHSRSQ